MQRLYATLIAALLLLAPVSASAAIKYVGTGWTDCAGGCDDEPGCGSSAANSCATLAYFTANIESTVSDGDTVRLNGTLISIGAVAGGNMCIMAKDGVTYEGRTAADGVADTFTDAVVDGTNSDASNEVSPCKGLMVNGDDRTFDRFTLRDMTIQNGKRTVFNFGGVQFTPPSKNGCPGANGHCFDLTIDRVKITGMASGGMHIGRHDTPVSTTSKCQGSYDVEDVLIVDSNISNNTGHGVVDSCVDGLTYLRTTISFNKPAGCSDILGDPSNRDGQCCFGCACDDGDGIISASRDVLIDDCDIFENGEDNIDIGNPESCNSDSCRCDSYAEVGIIQNSRVRDSCTNISFKHCSNDWTVRNNYIWGLGAGISQGTCGYDLKIYNNTMNTEGTAFFVFDYADQLDVRNNIIACNASIHCVYLDYLTTTSNGYWDHNIVQTNSTVGTGGMVRHFGTNGGGTSNNTPNCEGGTGAPWPFSPGIFDVGADAAPNGTNYNNNSTGFNNWQLDHVNGDLFGNGTVGSAVNDKWNILPNYIDATAGTAAGYHLHEDDTVATNAGICISSFSVDADGDSRPSCPSSSWSIGADQVGVSAVCGNDIIEGSEQCDNGADNGDTMPCTSQCQNASCGDGFTCSDGTCTSGQAGGVEQCDDGASNGNTKACTAQCQTASCGDGLTCSDAGCTSGPASGPEDCDRAGANSNTGICTAACADATCGDSLHCAEGDCTTGPASGPEECDGGVGTCGGPGGPFVCTACACVPVATTTTLPAPTTTTTTTTSTTTSTVPVSDTGPRTGTKSRDGGQLRAKIQ